MGLVEAEAGDVGGFDDVGVVVVLFGEGAGCRGSIRLSSET